MSFNHFIKIFCGTLVILHALHAPSAFGGKSKKTKKQNAAQACRQPEKPRYFCSAASKAKAPDTVDFETTRAMISECNAEAANCVQNILGNAPVHSIESSGDVALYVSRGEAQNWLKGPREWNPRAAKIVALTALYEGLASLDQNIETLDQVEGLEESNPGAFNALVQEAWEDVHHEIEACQSVKRAFGGSKMPSTKTYHRNLLTRQSEAVACAVRLNFDSLTPYRLLKTWPGCECSGSNGKTGRYFKSGDRFVCLSGLTPGRPIEERMPEAMAGFMSNLGIWADKNGLRVKEVQAGGCGIERFVSNGLVQRIKEAEASGNRDSVKIDLALVSGHAESRSCDLKWAKFESKDCTSKKCPEFKLGLGRDEGCAYSRALMAYSETSSDGLPMVQSGKPRVDASCGNDRKVDWSKLPRGLVDYRKLERRIDAGERPAKMSEDDWMQLKLGVGVRNAAVNGGLIVVDIVDHHIDHFHMSLTPRANEWEVMHSPLALENSLTDNVFNPTGGLLNISRRAIQILGRERIVACRLTDEIGGAMISCDIPDEVEQVINALRVPAGGKQDLDHEIGHSHSHE